MATLVLQAAGSALGGAIGGPIGAIIGSTLGAAVGQGVDQKLFGGNKDRVIHGRRLETSRFMGAGEGEPIPKVYGRMRVGGQLIWATHFEEERHTSTQSSGGKGGGGGGKVTTESFSYYGNFAMALCEGEVAHLGRIWADGREIDRTELEMRFYRGTMGQLPDPLIEAKQGTGSAPSYRGICYVVFEGLPLEQFGNRLPQLSFEIVRIASNVNEKIRSVCLIPGATEHGYNPELVSESKKGVTETANRHTLTAATDWHASIDELVALCPNLASVSLVVSWFGSDLRAGHCLTEPKVVHTDANAPWQVAGLARTKAKQVSRNAPGSPAYGGTPSDASVFAAIRDIKRRGLKINLYPFVMMDIAADNALPDPYGQSAQPAYPWRGRITASLAPGMAGSPDGSAAIDAQISQFTGAALPSHFSGSDGVVNYSGPAEWGYRRMILHYARLAHQAGGVDGFIIGSELRGLTQLRNAEGAFPFVTALRQLAGDVRSILDAETRLTYAADWSEYFGHHLQDGSGDVLFHLDSLWADQNIDAVGIDWYVPLSDWRQNGDPGDVDVASNADIDYLKAGIFGGEGYDWYYANQADRLAGLRTPISDGAGEAWIWRYKDMRSWWLNAHHERQGGVRSNTPTAWVPGMKPIWLTEAGCPAIDRGTNQPNVFIDAKASESGWPRFSTGGRDDLIQHRYIEAVTDFFTSDTGGPYFNNPLSPISGKPMIGADDVCFWAWDTRPFPAFPLHRDVWSDGPNWFRGHWLNGRLSGMPVDALVNKIGTDFGMAELECSANGFIEGYLVTGGNARAALEPLIDAFNLAAKERDGRLIFSDKAHGDPILLERGELAQTDDQALIGRSRAAESELPVETAIVHGDSLSQFDSTVSSSRRLETPSVRQVSMELPASIARPQALALAEARLRDAWMARDEISFALPFKRLGIEPSDRIEFDGETFRVRTVTDNLFRQIEAGAIALFDESAPDIELANARSLPVTGAGKPLALLLDLPLRSSEVDPDLNLYLAVYAKPWGRSYSALSSPSDNNYEAEANINLPSTIMELSAPLASGPTGRWDWANSLEISIVEGKFQSVEAIHVFGGVNAIAVRMDNGEWEIVQFKNAEIVASGQWKMTGLLRGQLGTDPQMRTGASAGANAVLLDRSITEIKLASAKKGLELNWAVGPAQQAVGTQKFTIQKAAARATSRRPLTPCHLKAAWQDDGGLKISWIRRSRLDSDEWDKPEIPLDHNPERYAIRLLNRAGSQITEIESGQNSAILPASSFVSIASGDAFEIAVAQIDAAGTTGPARHMTMLRP